LDEDPTALAHVFLGDLGKRAVEHHPVPFGVFLPLPLLVGPLLIGGDAEVGDAGAARGGTHLGLGAEVADDLDSIETAGHGERSLSCDGVQHTGRLRCRSSPARMDMLANMQAFVKRRWIRASTSGS